MSPLSRLVNVLVEPKAAFTDIAARPGWWAPMILLAVLSVVFMASFSSRVGWERFMRHQIETNKQTQDLPLEQREQIIALQAKFAGPFGMAMAVVGTPVIMLLTAGILLFIFNTALGASTNFKQTLGVSAYAMVPAAISTVVALLVLFLKEPADFDLNNPVGLNAGFYLDPASTKAWIVSLATSIDLFVIWMILLAATGMAIATRKPWKTALAGVAAPWLLIVLLKVGWAAFRG